MVHEFGQRFTGDEAHITQQCGFGGVGGWQYETSHAGIPSGTRQR
jgi:hypothetical protein